MPKNRLEKRMGNYGDAVNYFNDLPNFDLDFFESSSSFTNVLSRINFMMVDLGSKRPENEENNIINNQEDIKYDEHDNRLVKKNEIANLMALYKEAIRRLHELSVEILNKANENKYSRTSRRLKEFVTQNDKIARILSKDYAALEKAHEKGIAVSLDSIYESSRVNSNYRVVKIKDLEKGGQNVRQPITIKEQDKDPKNGYFTFDNNLKGDENLVNEINRIKRKYGQDADFLPTDTVPTIYDILKRNDDALTTVLSHQKAYSVSTYNVVFRYLSEKTGGALDHYFDTPKKLKIFLDVMTKVARVKNQIGVNRAIGITKGSNLNRRNSAMSSIADILGCSDVIAFSENIKIQSGNRTFKGTFMQEAPGTDFYKAEADSDMLKVSSGSINGLKLKKQIANLQVLDYICGNPDRHLGNMLYEYKVDQNGMVYIDSLKGIDNDSCLGVEEYENIGMRHVIKLNNMKVITQEMADAIMNLDPEKFKLMLYGFKLGAESVEKLIERYDKLYKKVCEDKLRYKPEHGKGYIIPNTIKIVDDEELSQLKIDPDLCIDSKTETNLFTKIRKLTKPSYIMETVRDNVDMAYRDNVYDVFLGDIDKIYNLVSKMGENTATLRSSKKYDDMYDHMKLLKKMLMEFSGPVTGKALGAEQSIKVREVMHQITQTLSFTVDYLSYKEGKHETWRDLPEGHEPTWEEKRYKVAEEASKLLMAKVHRFEELSKKYEKYKEYRDHEDQIKKNLVDAENKYLESKERFDFEQRWIENNYKNHVSMSEAEIKKVIEEGKLTNNEKQKMLSDIHVDMLIGFTLDTLGKEDRPAFKEKMENLTGRKLEGSDDDIIRRALACQLVFTKNKLESITPESRYPEDTTTLNNLKYIKRNFPKESVDKLLRDNNFKKYCKAYRKNHRNVHDNLYPGIKKPDRVKMAQISETFRNVMEPQPAAGHAPAAHH